MSVADRPAVYLIDDVCREFKISRRSLQRLRTRRCFPIAELPTLDSRPRWSAAKVHAFIDAGQPLAIRKRA